MTKPPGCVLDGDTIMFNTRQTQVTCIEGCLCEGIEDVKGVCSVHDFIQTDDGYREIYRVGRLQHEH